MSNAPLGSQKSIPAELWSDGGRKRREAEGLQGERTRAYLTEFTSRDRGVGTGGLARRRGRRGSVEEVLQRGSAHGNPVTTEYKWGGAGGKDRGGKRAKAPKKGRATSLPDCQGISLLKKKTLGRKK